MLLYLDMNIYCRDYDDQTQLKIRRECKAIENIFKLIKEGKCTLYGSFMLEFENEADTLDYRRVEVRTFFSKFDEYINKEPEIMKMAKMIMENSNVKTKDSIHLACAVYKKCEYFITCDNNFIKIIKNNIDMLKDIIGDIQMVNPVDSDEKEVGKDGK